MNSKYLQNKTPTRNIDLQKYTYESPYLNIKKRKNETPKFTHQINNSRYQGYLNNKIPYSNLNNNNAPLRRNLKDIYNSYNINVDIINSKSYTDLNKMRQTYYINSNTINKSNNYRNNNLNRFSYTLNKASNPIIPKKSTILTITHNNNNKIKNNVRYSSLSSYLSKYKKNNNYNKNIANQKKILPSNQSQKLFYSKNNINNNNNNRFIDNNRYIDNNYGNNVRLLDRTKEIMDNLKKSPSPFNSLQMFQIKCHNSQWECTPQRKTYTIDSRYYH
jgi:hypothetical protein